MFVKLTENEVLNNFKDNIGADKNIHYRCSECSDEQVSDYIEIDEEMVSTLEKANHLMVHLPCTNCGTVEKFIHKDKIIGIED